MQITEKLKEILLGYQFEDRGDTLVLHPQDGSPRVEIRLTEREVQRRAVLPDGREFGDPRSLWQPISIAQLMYWRDTGSPIAVWLDARV